MLFVFIYMGIFNEISYKQLRRLAGLPYMKGNKQRPAEPPSSTEEVTALLNKTSPILLVIIGYVIPAIANGDRT
jgi:hypothetical protein